MLLLGLVLLVGSGELLVKGAVNTAQRFKISPLVIGLTVVSLGTSAPELLVSLEAALNDHPDIAIGNVIGSNIANLCLVLGSMVVIYPIMVARDTLRIDWPVMMLATVLFALLIMDLELGLWEGTAFVVSLVLFVLFMVVRSRKLQLMDETRVPVAGVWPIHWAALAVAVACFGLVFGARWFLTGAEDIARSLGVSDHVIGVTLVAFGTSLPELVTSIIAAMRKQADLSIGNLVGSNIFNLLGILGVTSIVHPIKVNPAVLDSDIWWLLGSALILLPIMLGARVGRIKGLLLLAVYIIYVFLVLAG